MRVKGGVGAAVDDTPSAGSGGSAGNSQVLQLVVKTNGLGTLTLTTSLKDAIGCLGAPFGWSGGLLALVL